MDVAISTLIAVYANAEKISLKCCRRKCVINKKLMRKISLLRVDNETKLNGNF